MKHKIIIITSIVLMIFSIAGCQKSNNTKKFSYNDLGLTFEYPKDWRVLDQETLDYFSNGYREVVFSISKDEDNDWTNLMVTVQEIGRELTIDEYIDGKQAFSEKAEKIKIDGKEFVIFKNVEGDSHFEDYITTENKSIISVYIQYDENDKEYIKEIVDSFQYK